MKKILLIVVLICISGLSVSYSQTVHQYAEDGKIWLKLRDDMPRTESLNFIGQPHKSTFDAMLAELPFLEDMVMPFEIYNISKPFANSKAPKVNQVYQIEFNKISQVNDFLNQLNNVHNVEYAELVPIYVKTLVPNDPQYSVGQQWGLFKIQAQDAWDFATGSSDVIVAIVDDAVDITHPDLSPILWTNPGETPGNGIDDDGNGVVDDIHGADVANGTGNPNPIAPYGNFDHGTHVAGIACAATNNSVGIASIGHNVSLMSVRTASNNGTLTSALQGVSYAIDNGAHVINMSFGSPSFNTTFQNLVTFGHDQGVVMVAAAGNDGVSDKFYPAAYDNVISVAATRNNDNKAGFSNYDDGTGWIDIAAPGTSIYSTLPSQGGTLYGNKQGTSMASPHVAGLAGLMLSLNPGLQPDDIKDCLLSTADPVLGSFSALLGAGRINAREAMSCVSATLNWAPEANFTSNVTTIAEGASVDFTDLSIYNPTSWSWTFTGGTPGTSNQQNPTITYNTPGTYAVTLQAINANGSDDTTKVAYIQVNPATGCDSVRHTIASDQNIISTAPSAPNYLGGTNANKFTAFADYFDGSLFSPGSYIQGMVVNFVRGVAVDDDDVVTINVWDATGTALVTGDPAPGNIIHTETQSLKVIEQNTNIPGQPGSFYRTMVYFDEPFEVTGDIFVGIEIPDPVPAGREYAIAYTQPITDGRPNTAFMFLKLGNTISPGTTGWVAFEEVFVGNPKRSLQMILRTTQFPVQADLVASDATICTGEQVSFENGEMANVAQNEFYIGGVQSGYSSDNNPSFTFNVAGTFTSYLVAANTCGYFAIDSVDITINQSPIISVSPQDPTICPGDDVTLNASGADTYAWSPAGSLDVATGTTVVASPTQSTTYTVFGSDANCSSEATVEVIVETEPVVDIIFNPQTDICANQPVYFDGGANSEGVTNYSWSFTSGDPATSMESTEFVSFPPGGPYTVTLTGSNSCGDDDVASVQITLDNSCDWLGVDVNQAQEIQGYLNPLTEDLHITFDNVPSGNYDVAIYSLTGQLIDKTSLNVSGNTYEYIMKTDAVAEGLYIGQISRANTNHTFKFKK